MGVFLQNALFPGCDEPTARAAVGTAAKTPELHIDLEKCKYAQTCEGTQVLMEWDLLGFEPLAMERFVKCNFFFMDASNH